MLLLSLQSALYSCPRRTSRFLEVVVTTRTTTTLAYNTTIHKISCHSAHQVQYLMLLESTTPFYLAIYGCCSKRFLWHRSYVCTCLDHELKLCGWDSVHAHVQLSCVYLVSTLDVTYVIKCTRLSLTLTMRAWERGYSFTRIQIQTSVYVCCMHTCVMWIPFPSLLLNNLDRDCLACKRKHRWNSTSRQACFVLVLYLPQLYK